jgi:uncharacterized membrane protein
VTDNRLRVAIAVLALAGAAIAGYLVHARTTGATLLCTTGGCDTVQNSSYAEVLGIPVALLGGLSFGAIFLSALLRGELARVGGAALAVSGLGFGAYLLVIQIFVIGAVCDWCLATDGIMTVLAGLTLVRLAPEAVSAAVRRHTRRFGHPGGRVVTRPR